MYTDVLCGLSRSTNVTLSGDADHAMTPTLGRGANGATRDGVLLAVHLGQVVEGRQTLVQSLAEYETKMTTYGFGVDETAVAVGYDVSAEILFHHGDRRGGPARIGGPGMALLAGPMSELHRSSGETDPSSERDDADPDEDGETTRPSGGRGRGGQMPVTHIPIRDPVEQGHVDARQEQQHHFHLKLEVMRIFVCMRAEEQRPRHDGQCEAGPGDRQDFSCDLGDASAAQRRGQAVAGRRSGSTRPPARRQRHERFRSWETTMRIR